VRRVGLAEEKGEKNDKGAAPENAAGKAVGWLIEDENNGVCHHAGQSKSVAL